MCCIVMTPYLTLCNATYQILEWMCLVFVLKYSVGVAVSDKSRFLVQEEKEVHGVVGHEALQH